MESNTKEISWSQKTHSDKFQPRVHKIKDAHENRTKSIQSLQYRFPKINSNAPTDEEVKKSTRKRRNNKASFITGT